MASVFQGIPLLNKGDELALTDGRHIKVIDFIGGGGEGQTYKVEAEGADSLKVLKFIFPDFASKRKYEHFDKLARRESPHNSFLWPEGLTEFASACNVDMPSFGYIMDLAPANYISFAKVFELDSDIDFSVLLEAAISLTDSFQALHLAGYSYKDLNHNNFMLDPKTGDVLIFDTDNISGYGYSSGVLGFYGYMAPEVVRGEKMPDADTDLYSLSVIIFRLLIGLHPLEGKRTFGECLDEDFYIEFHGKNPLFIFDENDHGNKIPEDDDDFNEELYKWSIMPDFMKSLFKRAFNRENNLLAWRDRILTTEWLNALLRIKGSLYECPNSSCNAMLFLNEDKDVVCQSCKTTVHPGAALVFNNGMRVPILDKVEIYKTVVFSEAGCREKLGAIEYDGDDNVYYLRNLSGETWEFVSNKGQQLQCPYKRSCPMQSGATVVFRRIGRHNIVDARIIPNKIR